MLPLLSHVQATALLEAKKTGVQETQSSLDLGLTAEDVALQEAGVRFASGITLSWEQLLELTRHENTCVEWVEGELIPVRGYSEETRRTYQLMPTLSAPAMLISGFVMHRIRDVSPEVGARAMVKAVLPFKGRLLDTATGLGYAAIEAAKYASEVVTVELDPMAQSMARRNPWSRPLFDAPNLQQLIGNSADVIQSLETGSFSAIVHDPPAINLAGELYAESFYAEAHRVLSSKGKMFHYIGDPASASGGRVTKGVVRRLQNAGFRRVLPIPKAFGVLARKS